MLVLTRKPMERIRIADSVEIVVLGIRGGRAQIGIECSKEIPVMRTELLGSTLKSATSAELVIGAGI